MESKKIDPAMYDANTKLDWWAYLHTNGNIVVKRFLSPVDVAEAHESDFAVEVMAPYKATGHDDAFKKATEFFNRSSYGED